MNATIISRGESHRFRYIRCGHVNYDGPISEYRLIGGNNLGDSASCIRIKLPNLFHMTKYACDSYSTTDDKRSLNEIGYDILVKINGRWVVRNDLKGIQPNKIYHAMIKEGRGYTVTGLGYLTANQYTEYNRRRDDKIRNALKNNRLPDEPEFAEKFAIVWTEDNGNIGWCLYDNAREANRTYKTMKSIENNTIVIYKNNIVNPADYI